MKPKNSFLEKVKAELIWPEVEKMVKAEDFPSNSLDPKEIWEEKLGTELMELFSGESVIDKTEQGFDAIVLQLTPLEAENIGNEWKEGVALWIKKTNSIEAGLAADCMQEIMEISEATLNRFYEIGNYYFEHQDYKRASDVFFVIVSLDPRRHNGWVALALSEVHQEHWDQALVSFSMASLMDIKSPYPYLYSAECCLRLNKKDESKVYLDLAKDAIENGQFKEKEDLLNSLQRIEHEQQQF